MGKAYNSKLRVRKRFLENRFFGKFGKSKIYDFTDGGILWKDMPEEAIEEFAKVHNKATVDTHLIGELPKIQVSKEKVSDAPVVK